MTKQCKCEHWQECPVCQPRRFDADGNRLPPEPTPLQAARAQIEKDTALLRQALEAMEILRNGLIQMREHAESYGEAWSRAYIKEYRDLLPGSAEEQFRALNAMQHRLADVADGVVKGFDAIAALRERLGETK